MLFLDFGNSFFQGSGVCLQLRGVLGQDIKLAYIRLPLGADPGEKLQGVIIMDEDLLPGGVSPALHKELCYSIDERGSPLSYELPRKQSIHNCGHRNDGAIYLCALKCLLQCLGNFQMIIDIK